MTTHSRAWIMAVAGALALTGACASSVVDTRAAPDATVPPPDPLDDLTLRVDCPPGMPDPCGPGRHCIAIGPGVLGICVREGSRGGLCRLGDLPCDEGIACVMQWCDRNNHFGPRTVCDTRSCGLGEGCVAVDGRLRCVAYGAAGGYCRDVGAPCDTGLRCDAVGDHRSRCGAPIPLGGACNPSLGTEFCLGDAVCVGAAMSGTCRRRGVEGVACRVDGTCDDGLECQFPVRETRAVCLVPIREGAVCSPTDPGAPQCERGTNCVNGNMGPRCARDGTLDAMCRGNEPACDDGLVCRRSTRLCVTPRPAGSFCVVEDADCAVGARCIALSLRAAFCMADGAVGGACRDGSAPCDAGLVCRVESIGRICRAP